MIRIINKDDCCGCSACEQICPKHCITLTTDEEGFLYPRADTGICIDCGLCEKVCPVINQRQPKRPLNVYAAINPDEEIRQKSSSGGIFTALAKNVLSEGGIVFGALYDSNWEVIHGYVSSVNDLYKLRGSKYVQSRIGTTYQEVESFLKSGNKVLFSGTSCQVAGLNNFLRKEYDNLLTVEVVCHGVPSPLLWKEYISSLKSLATIKGVNMKDKSEGWKGYKITIEGENETKSERASINKYMLAFSQNLSLRPSCFQCPAKQGKSGSDITLADYWGVENLIPRMYDDKGTSFVCVNTLKGQSLFERLSLNKEIANYEASIPYNTCIIKSTAEPLQRAKFWNQYKEKGIDALKELKPYKPNIVIRAIHWLERKFK